MVESKPGTVEVAITDWYRYYLYGSQIKTRYGGSHYDKLIPILSLQRSSQDPLWRIDTNPPTQAVEPTPAIVDLHSRSGSRVPAPKSERRAGPKENPTSHAKGEGKNDEGNLSKQKGEVKKWESELPCGRGRTKIKREEKRKWSLRSTPIWTKVAPARKHNLP